MFGADAPSHCWSCQPMQRRRRDEASVAKARAEEALLARRLALAARILQRRVSRGEDWVPKNKSRAHGWMGVSSNAAHVRSSNTADVRHFSRPARWAECSSGIQSVNQPASKIRAESLQHKETACSNTTHTGHRQARAKGTLLGNSVAPQKEDAVLQDGSSKTHAVSKMPHLYICHASETDSAEAESDMQVLKDLSCGGCNTDGIPIALGSVLER
eukprot:TRINITY_DN16495_c1_g1_i1.p3 TRINITY_DN16495_c1_g1~~TRINITY_DN16495_c1_g1_i1.p3  ORF type:complete len:215 (+),score=35.86 TRINITY_DN16495_c1_g1_i1:159-803(+)